MYHITNTNKDSRSEPSHINPTLSATQTDHLTAKCLHYSKLHRFSNNQSYKDAFSQENDVNYFSGLVLKKVIFMEINRNWNVCYVDLKHFLLNKGNSGSTPQNKLS